MNRYMVLDVGCIECGETTSIVGLYPTVEEAEPALAVAQAEQERNWQGQHWFQIWDLETLQEVLP